MKDTNSEGSRGRNIAKMRFSLLNYAVLLLIPSAQPIYAQDWSKIFDPVSPYQAIYFLNPNVGFTFEAGITFNEEVPMLPGALYSPLFERTLDGGQTWKSFPFFDTSQYFITDLYFTSLTHGYASVFFAGLNGGIYETFDQGKDWKKITPDGHRFSSVYVSRNVIFASEMLGSTEGPVWYSSDDGVTWQSILTVTGLGLSTDPHFQLIYGNRDSLVATVYFSPGEDTYIVFSTNLGKTWQSSPLDQQYQRGMVSLFIVPHTCNVIREHVDTFDQRNDTYSFLESSLSDITWRPSLLHSETGAWIAGNGCAIYLCNANGYLYQPLLRSMDRGFSWLVDSSGLENPNFMELDDEDFKNLSVVGYGAVIYASNSADRGEGIWKTTDGGDGSLSAAMLAPKLALAHAPFSSGTDTLPIPSCETSQLTVTNYNIGCSWATFDSVTIDGLNPSEYSITSTHYCGCTRLPDTSFITLTPTQSGVCNIAVHFHYTDDEYNQIDTTMPIVLDVKSGGTAMPLSLTLGSGTAVAHAGDTIAVPVYVTSHSMITFADTISILLLFTLDTNTLKVLDFVPAFGGTPNDSLGYADGTGASSTMLTVLLQIKGLTVSGKTLIGTLRCVVYLADTLQINVSLAGASITASTGGCVALSTDLNGVNLAITGCGDSTLLKFMQTESLPSLIQMSPNPATDQVSVVYQSGHNRPISTELYDALGSPRAITVHQSNTANLNLARLPDGIYILIAECQGQVFARRTIVVAR